MKRISRVSVSVLEPYQTFGQSCRSLSCNVAHGLICGQSSICQCPASDSFWSWNNTGCRLWTNFVLRRRSFCSFSGRCPSGWSMLNGKCLFVSQFHLNWTQALEYCRSAAARLFTFSSTMNSTALSSFVSTNQNYFIGLAEQPVDSSE